ncbi:MAG: hypothetical protein J6D03_01665 [Clostridia bacterium]|nr:hypothetical protein [Clostridia bacterium]
MKEEKNYIKINVEHDLSEKLSYIAYDEFNKPVGTLKVENGEVKWFDNGSNKTSDWTNNIENFNQFVRDYNYIFRKDTDDCWIEYNPNPQKNNVGDCTIRAYCKFTGKTWNEMYDMSAKFAKDNAAMMDASNVVRKFIKEKLNCSLEYPKKEDRMTIKEFAKTHNKGKYIVGVRGHVVTIIDGYYYDSWDSGSKIINHIFTPNNQ